MALVVCPECGREKISDKAVACPDCGFPIAEHFKESSNGDNTEIDTKKEREVREVTIGDVTYCYLSEYEELGKVRDFVADASNDATRELIKKYYENAEVKGLAVFDGCLVNLIKDGWLSVTDKCVAFLMKNGIDDIDRKELRSITRERPQYKNYMLEYKRLLNGDVKQVKDEIEKIHLKRSGERSNRSEWRAMGFGVKNAIVASVKASILNAIQSSIRSVGDNLIDASDRNRIDSMTENLLYDEKLIKLLAKIFFGECFNYYYALEYILSQHGIISSYDYSKHSEFEKNERILNNYYRNIDEIDDVDEKIDAVMKTMFESDPFNVVNYGNMLYHNIEDYDKIFKLADSFGVGYELFYSDELENTVFSLCEDLYEEAKETNYSDEDDLEFFKEDVQILKRAFNYLVVRDDLFGINTFWLNVIIPKLEKMDFSFFENKKESDDENEAKNDETLLVGNDIEAEDNSNTEIKDNWLFRGNGG